MIKTAILLDLPKVPKVIISLIVYFVLFNSIAFSATVTPVLQSAQNYNGKIGIFWDVTTNVPTSGTDYYVYISSLSLAGQTTTQLEANANASKITIGYTSGRYMYYFWNQAALNTRYYVRVAAYDSTNTLWTSASNEASVTAMESDLSSQTRIKMYVDGVEGNTLNYDSSTIRISLVTNYIPSNSVGLDIKTYVNPQSIFFGEDYAPHITMESGYDGTVFLATATWTWYGNVFDHGSGQHKHNGCYMPTFYPIVAGSFVTDMPIVSTYVYVDVVHVNIGKGIVYETQGNSEKEIHYGPPFKFDYSLSKDCFVTWKIYDRNQTLSTADDTLVRVVMSSAPRTEGDSYTSNQQPKPGDWDKKIQTEIWDGRNDKGLIVSNDVYRYTFEAIETWDKAGSGFSAANVDSTMVEGTIAFDVLRLINVSAEGIDNKNSLAHFKYNLAGANTKMGGAQIKLVICSPGTTFYMTTSSGTLTYMNGTSSYTYLVGDALPFNKENIKKIFVFSRTAGDQDETWNGYDDSGTSLPNDNYVYAMSATDDSGNHAIDNSGNDRVIIGNVTIDRTQAQAAADSEAPSVTSISVSGSSITLTGSSTFSQPFTTISLVITDTGGSGVDLTNTAISLVNPSGAVVSPTTTTNDSVGTITLTYASQSTNGTYSLRVRPRDKTGNTASESIYTFAISITAAGVAAAFEESVNAYPNPAKGQNSITFSYTVSTTAMMKLEIFSLLGELVYSEEWTPAATGSQLKTWNIVNQSNKKLASGVYLYRLAASGSGTKKFKKIVIVQ